MEDVDCLESVDVHGVTPIVDVLARPFDEVLELLVPDYVIKHLFHLSFFISVNFYWWWQW